MVSSPISIYACSAPARSIDYRAFEERKIGKGSTTVCLNTENGWGAGDAAFSQPGAHYVLINGLRTPPVALSDESKKSSRKMSRGNNRLFMSTLSAASTIGGGPQR
jgi:hypothetical protein